MPYLRWEIYHAAPQGYTPQQSSADWQSMPQVAKSTNLITETGEIIHTSSEGVYEHAFHRD